MIMPFLFMGEYTLNPFQSFPRRSLCYSTQSGSVYKTIGFFFLFFFFKLHWVVKPDFSSTLRLSVYNSRCTFTTSSKQRSLCDQSHHKKGFQLVKYITRLVISGLLLTS